MTESVSQKPFIAPVWYSCKVFMLLSAIFLLPALLFHFMLPFTDSQIVPGRAFIRYYQWYQMEHLISVKFGSFPIYLPFASGGDFSPLTAGMGQLFLPLPYIASLLPGYWTGYALDWLLLINLLTISAVHLALFLFLKRLQLRPLLALVLSTITVYSPRALLCLCYGTSTAAWTGHILLCSMLGLYFLKPTRIKGPLLIIGAGYWLLNCGHPEEAYYCMLGTWIFVFLLPYVVEASSSDDRPPVMKKFEFWWFWVICCSLSLLLSSAYIVPFYIEVVRNMDFANMAYKESVPTLDTLPGLIYNFFLPVKTGLFGCFCGTSMYLLVVLVPLTRIFRIPVGRGIWLVFFFIVLVFLYMAGDATPIFSVFWKLLPFSTATRNPARASLIMPIIFLLGLIWFFKTEKPLVFVLFKRKRTIPVKAILSGAGILVFFTGLAYLLYKSYPLSPHAQLNNLFIPSWVIPSLIATGSLTLLTVAIHSLTVRYKIMVEIILCGLICAHLVMLMKYGSVPFNQKEKKDTLTLEQLIAQKKRTLKLMPGYLFLYEKGASQAELAQFDHYFVEPHLGQIFRKHVSAINRQDAYRILNQERKRDEVVLEGYDDGTHQTVISSDCQDKIDRVRLKYSTYNRLVFEAESCQSGFFLLSYPDPEKHWRARVNGMSMPIYTPTGYPRLCISRPVLPRLNSAIGVMPPSGGWQQVA